MFEADISDVVYDEEYKISRPYNQNLSISIKRSGLANPLILIENGSSFRILSGHNRFMAMRDASIAKFIAVKTVSIHEEFRKEIIKKNYSGLLSFSGKLKACKYFYSDTDLMNELGIPASRRTANDILIPDSILDYFNEKDAPLKILDEMLMLDYDIISAYESFITAKGFKFALFRESVAIVSDILKLTGKEDIISVFDNASDDIILIQDLKRIRYPLMSSLLEKSASLSERFRNAGMNLTFPQNFDGGFADISIRIKKKTKASDFFGACGKLTDSDIDDIIGII